MSTRRLKIAFIVGKFPALSETFILDQIIGLIDAGHEVDIFAWGYSLEEKIQPAAETSSLAARTYYLKAPTSRATRIWNALGMISTMVKKGKPGILRALNVLKFGMQAASLKLLYQLYPILDRGPYDILHCHFGTIGLVGTRLKDMGVPGKFIVTFHGHDISKFLNVAGNDVYRHMFEKADLLMPVSGYWQQRLIELGANPGRVQVHRMGIDPYKFHFHPRSMEGQNKICLLTVGRLVEKKGITIALQAFASLVQRHPEWKICYNIIGSGEEEGNLREMIDRLGLQENVCLLGSKTREEVRSYMMDSHIFLLPSHTDASGDQEGIPVVLMEAMATGMPVLSTQHTGIPELVKHGSSGYLVPEEDIEGLTNGLEYLIAHPERWPEMGRHGRRFIEAHHDVHKLNRHLSDIYHALIAETRENSAAEAVS